MLFSSMKYHGVGMRWVIGDCGLGGYLGSGCLWVTSGGVYRHATWVDQTDYNDSIFPRVRVNGLFQHCTKSDASLEWTGWLIGT